LNAGFSAYIESRPYCREVVDRKSREAARHESPGRSAALGERIYKIHSPVRARHQSGREPDIMLMIRPGNIPDFQHFTACLPSGWMILISTPTQHCCTSQQRHPAENPLYYANTGINV